MSAADTLSASLIPLVIFAVFALARRFSPPTEPAHLDPAHLAEMRARWGRLNAVSTAAALVAMPVMVIVVTRVLGFFGALVPRFGPAWRFVTMPSKDDWLVIGIFVGIGAAAIVLTMLGRAVLGRARYDAFEAVSNENHGFNSNKLAQWVLVPIVGLAVAAIPIGLHAHTRFGEREMTTYPALHWTPVRHAYTDVVDIERATHYLDRDGNLHPFEQVNYFVRFRDGTRWTNRTDVRDGEPRDEEIVRFVSERSGVPIERRPPRQLD